MKSHFEALSKNKSRQEGLRGVSLEETLDTKMMEESVITSTIRGDTLKSSPKKGDDLKYQTTISNDFMTHGEFTTNAQTFDTIYSKSPTNYEKINEKWRKEHNDPLDYPLRKRDSSKKDKQAGRPRVKSSAAETIPFVEATECNPVRKSIIKKRNLIFNRQEKFNTSYKPKLAKSDKKKTYLSS